MDNLRDSDRSLTDFILDNGLVRDYQGEEKQESISESVYSSRGSSELYTEQSSDGSSEFSKSGETSSEGSSEEGSEEYSSEYTESTISYEQQINDLVASNRAQTGLFMILLVGFGLFITVRYFLRLFNK